MAHEIRNPLTGIKMIVQILLSELSSQDSKREPLGIILTEIGRLEKIISNLLGFARPSKPQAVLIALSEILETCILLLQNQISKLELDLIRSFPDHEIRITGDPDRLKQVFLNILKNAIEASSSKGTLSVGLLYTIEEAIVSISDSGSGIQKEKIKNIFDPFMTTKDEGTGLGLSIALRIVEDHGGRIEVETTERMGSKFSVHLPRTL
ncbi:GHKL domain-containing protein [bacterium]|nr:GHKL domain-containing protein [bacterium]